MGSVAKLLEVESGGERALARAGQHDHLQAGSVVELDHAWRSAARSALESAYIASGR